MTLHLSEHDRDVIEDVSVFCGTDLATCMAVWLADGWAFASDSYRIDAREVDTDWSGAIDPTTFRPMPRAWKVSPDWWGAVASTRRGRIWDSRVLAATDLPDLPIPRWSWRTVCVGCMAASDLAAEGDGVPCDCTDPLVNLAWLREAVAAFDDPPTVTWTPGQCHQAVRLDEPEHFHLLMPVRRRKNRP